LLQAKSYNTLTVLRKKKSINRFVVIVFQACVCVCVWSVNLEKSQTIYTQLSSESPFVRNDRDEFRITIQLWQQRRPRRSRHPRAPYFVWNSNAGKSHRNRNVIYRPRIIVYDTPSVATLGENGSRFPRTSDSSGSFVTSVLFVFGNSKTTTSPRDAKRENESERHRKLVAIR